MLADTAVETETGCDSGCGCCGLAPAETVEASLAKEGSSDTTLPPPLWMGERLRKSPALAPVPPASPCSDSPLSLSLFFCLSGLAAAEPVVVVTGAAATPFAEGAVSVKEPTDKELMEEAGGGGGPVLSLAPDRPGLDAMRCGPGKGKGGGCCNCSSWSDFLVAELDEGVAAG